MSTIISLVLSALRDMLSFSHHVTRLATSVLYAIPSLPVIRPLWLWCCQQISGWHCPCVRQYSCRGIVCRACDRGHILVGCLASQCVRLDFQFRQIVVCQWGYLTASHRVWSSGQGCVVCEFVGEDCISCNQWGAFRCRHQKPANVCGFMMPEGIW